MFPFLENAIEAFKGFAPFCVDGEKGSRSGDDDDGVEDEVKKRFNEKFIHVVVGLL